MAAETQATVKNINAHCTSDLRHHTAGYHYPTHWHNYLELEIVLSGEYEHVCGGTAYTAVRGDAWFIPRLGFHSVRARTASSIRNISFSEALIPSRLADALPPSTGLFCRFAEAELGVMIRLGERIRDELRARPPYYELALSACLTDCLLRLMRHAAPDALPSGEKMPGCVEEVLRAVRLRYAEDLSLAALAQENHVSAGHLGLLFRECCGLSFSEYLNRVRLRVASDLLLHSDLSVREIAARAGYRSQEYFHSVFRRCVGSTPGAYRKNNPPV